MDTHRSALRRGSPWRLLALLVTLALVVAACGGGRDDDDDSAQDTPPGDTSATTEPGEEPGINTDDCATDPTLPLDGDTITFGTSLPQSETYAAFKSILLGSKAFLQYQNEELGGVEIAGQSYQIELLDKDDKYDAQQTVTNVTELVADEQVFALFNVVGTKNNLAIRDFVSEQCVPVLFAGTGSPAWGNPDYPWLIGSELVPYSNEMKALVDYLQENNPDAKVAILRAADDFGRAYSETFAGLIEGTDITIADEQEYNAEQFDVKSQVTALAATDADTYIVGATLLACVNALTEMQASGWQPEIVYASGTCTSKTLMSAAGAAADGVISVAPLMDPVNPIYADEEAMKLYQEKMAQYQPDADAGNGIVAYGWSTAALLVKALEQAEAVDRLSVMESARNLDVSGIALQLPGASWVVNDEDRFLGENFQLAQYGAADGYFTPLGDLIDVNGQTAEFTPPDLING